MADEVYLVTDATRIEIEERLLRDRAGAVGAAGSPVPTRQVGGGTSAKWIRFTLPGALATTDSSKASCTVDGYWDGPNPGSTVTVYNLPASSNYLFSGASGHKGLATYDNLNAKYWIVQMECP
jgi:hypothetical protein